MGTELCKVCGFGQEIHSTMNHEFSVDGSLVIRVKPEKPAPPAASGIDVPLRLLLLELGVVTGEQLLETETKLRQQLTQRDKPE